MTTHKEQLEEDIKTVIIHGLFGSAIANLPHGVIANPIQMADNAYLNDSDFRSRVDVMVSHIMLIIGNQK